MSSGDTAARNSFTRRSSWPPSSNPSTKINHLPEMWGGGPGESHNIESAPGSDRALTSDQSTSKANRVSAMTDLARQQTEDALWRDAKTIAQRQQSGAAALETQETELETQI